MDRYNRDFENNEIFSRKIRAGKRTYIFDVRSTRGNDYYITITERKRRMEDGSIQKSKIFLYKEDFNKFVEAMNEAVGYVKTDLLPDYDFDKFSRPLDEEDGNGNWEPDTQEQPAADRY